MTRYDHQQERGFDFWVLRDPWGTEFGVLHPRFPELLARRRPWTSSGVLQAHSSYSTLAGMVACSWVGCRSVNRPPPAALRRREGDDRAAVAAIEEDVMGALVVNMFMSLDGVLQGPGGPEEDREGGFAYGGWQAPYVDEESGKVIGDHLAGLEALLLGRKTYAIFAAYWPNQPAENPIAARLNGAPKYVASRTLDTVGWTNSRLIQGDLAQAVAQLKGEFGRVDVIGSGDLVQTLLGNDLVDRLNLWVYPVLLGSGKRLFAEGTVPTALRLVESATFPKGVVHLIYERAGKPTFGSMA